VLLQILRYRRDSTRLNQTTQRPRGRQLTDLDIRRRPAVPSLIPILIPNLRVPLSGLTRIESNFFPSRPDFCPINEPKPSVDSTRSRLSSRRTYAVERRSKRPSTPLPEDAAVGCTASSDSESKRGNLRVQLNSPVCVLIYLGDRPLRSSAFGAAR
jgi:hypothetical protein